MALSDILLTIEQETQQQADKIKKEGELQKQELAKELNADLEKRKQELTANFEQRASKKLAQAGWEFSSRTQTAVLTKKQELLDSVFERTLKQMANMSDSDYTALVTDLFKSLPAMDEGTVIVPAKGKEDATKKAAEAAGIKADLAKEGTKSAGGFIVKTNEMNIDLTFEAIVKSYRSDHESDIAAKLFTN